jgi:hypothetical protein
MDEKDLQEKLAELRDTWRVPRDPPLAEMWQAIEVRAFPPSHQGGRSRWIRTILPLAATLIVGFAIGQITPSLRQGPVVEPAPAEAGRGGGGAASAPFIGVANNYLERVTALLVTLTEEAGQGRPFDYSSARARDLLATTRLLLDSPDISDPVLRDLLDDLELVLAQIVRLPQRATAPDVYLIDQALDQREVLPRLRVMLAENPTSEP